MKEAVYLGVDQKTGDARYRCPYCKKIFTSWELFIKRVQARENVNLCPLCYKEIEGV